MTPAPRRDQAPSPFPRGLIVLLGTTGAVITVAGMRSFAGILGPVFLALVLTVAAHPLQGLLRRRGAPPWAALVGTLAAIYLVLLALVAALVVAVARLATLLPTYQDRFTELVDRVGRALADLGIGGAQVRDTLSGLDLGSLAGLLESVLTGLLGTLSDLVLVVTVLLFMGMDAAGFSRRLTGVAAERSEFVDAMSRFAHGTRRYLLVATVFGLIVAVLDSGALALLGIPLALLWGLLSFITNYIPNIGFVIGLVPPALLGLLEGGPGLMAAVIVVYSVINVILQSVIQPKFVGDAVGLSTTLSFLSLVFWTWVIGPLGALLAIPLTLLTKALLLDVDPSTRWLSSLISSGQASTRADPPTPTARTDPAPVPDEEPVSDA